MYLELEEKIKKQSLLDEGKLYVRELLGRYEGCRITEELVARIAMEAFLSGRLGERSDVCGKPLNVAHLKH